ncbi:MAG: GTPase ObgE [Candidatus Omnitrophota bacterium]
MFVDSVKIYVRGGNGSRGCQSFYRDKYTRHPIPNGGDGGKGSDIIIKADRNLYTLLDFKYNSNFRGPNGGRASSNKKKGKDASSIIIPVPIGTTIKDIKTNCVLRDLDKDQQEVIVAYGGKGGLGNQHHKEASDGEPGEEKELLLDLKVIADVGIVGFPNAGKSTLISSISNAHPKVASYPFTTKSPILGVVNYSRKPFTVADIPGLIKGSSEGRGLGDRFLRHIERTRIIIHIVDISSSEGRDPVEDYKTINEELKNYSEEVSSDVKYFGARVNKKPQIIVANKMDITGADSNLKIFKKAVKKKVYPISALKKEGLEELIEAIVEKL